MDTGTTFGIPFEQVESAAAYEQVLGESALYGVQEGLAVVGVDLGCGGAILRRDGQYGLDVFGGKWKSRILCVLSDGSLRYSELRKEMHDVTDAAMSSALKELAGDGLVRRRQFEEIPPRVEYSLTEKGKTVIPVLQMICKWSGIVQRGIEVTAPRCQACDYKG